jgi:hypothetical protein
MSVLAKIRGELLSNITIAEKRQRKALIVLFDAIDSDLDMGYTMSSTTEEALDEYNAALMALDVEDDDPPTNVPETDTSLTQVDVKEREIEVEE